MAARSPSQTIGPFFHEALRWKDGARVTGGAGRIVISGRMTDGNGAPVGDALLETWQRVPAQAPSPDGRPHGFARVETKKDGTFRIETSMPDAAAPYLDVAIFARGLLKGLHTRVYLVSPEVAARDPALAPIAASPRLATLVARRSGDGDWQWDVRLQGEGETIFFEIA